jgi:hypothetical protein
MLAGCLEASGSDIPASGIEAGMELHLPSLAKVGQGNNGFKAIEEFLPETASNGSNHDKSSIYY